MHLLRKILVALPALWLLASLVFLLSRLLPGSFAEERLLQDASGYYATATQANRQQVYRDYVQRTGQHKPLFYVSVSAAPLPDTLLFVFPEERRMQLTSLQMQCRNWALISAYDISISQVQSRLFKEKAASPYLHTLRYSSNLKAILAAADTLQHNYPGTAENVKPLAQQLYNSRKPYHLLLPHLAWHGTDNQYHRWLLDLLSLDFGTSYRTGRAVADLLWEAIGNTFVILLISMLVVMFFALELGMLLAKEKMLWLRRLSFPALFILDSIPTFVLALLLLVLFASPAFLQLFPVYGLGYYSGAGGSIWQQLQHSTPYLVLPVLCLVLASLPYLTNQVYAALQAALQADYTRTARAKGSTEHQVIRYHALRNALLPLITIAAEFLPALIDGALIIETIFAIPGMGRLLVESVLARDYPVLVAIVLVVLVVRFFSYLLAELCYGWADPRLKSKAA